MIFLYGGIEMEEINFSEFFVFVKKHLVFFVSMILLVLVICIFYLTLIKKPLYSSDVSLTLTGVSGNESKITTNDITLNTKMLPTYQEVITSRKVLNQVINNLKLNKTVEDLVGHIKIQASTDSMVLSITVTDSNRVIAKDIANEVASIFGKEVQELYNIQNVTVLDQGIVNDRPTNVNYIKTILLSFVGGIMFSLICLFIVFYLDATVKGMEQVNTKLGLIVLGGVPLHTENQKSGRKGMKRR